VRVELGPLDVLSIRKRQLPDEEAGEADEGTATARPTIPPVPSVLPPPITTTTAAAELDANEDGEERGEGVKEVMSMVTTSPAQSVHMDCEMEVEDC
jgi:hypothetical protein